MKRAIYPGSFDPITLGHLDIIERTAQLFDEVWVAVAPSARKAPFFSLEERLSLAEAACAFLPSVRVIPLESLLVNVAAFHQIQYIVKGLRSAFDADYEMPQAWMNQQLSQRRLETVCFFASQKVAAISSTMVREILSLGGNASPFLPEAVASYWAQKKQE